MKYKQSITVLFILILVFSGAININKKRKTKTAMEIEKLKKIATHYEKLILGIERVEDRIIFAIHIMNNPVFLEFNDDTLKKVELVFNKCFTKNIEKTDGKELANQRAQLMKYTSFFFDKNSIEGIKENSKIIENEEMKRTEKNKGDK